MFAHVFSCSPTNTHCYFNTVAQTFHMPWHTYVSESLFSRHHLFLHTPPLSYHKYLYTVHSQCKALHVALFPIGRKGNKKNRWASSVYKNNCVVMTTNQIFSSCNLSWLYKRRNMVVMSNYHASHFSKAAGHIIMACSHVVQYLHLIVCTKNAARCIPMSFRVFSSRACNSGQLKYFVTFWLLRRCTATSKLQCSAATAEKKKAHYFPVCLLCEVSVREAASDLRARICILPAQ